MMPAVSVIVPVYGVEPYLERCVDSLLAQSLSNIEVVLVDDGSPDGCGDICDRYAITDARVRVIHQRNRGLSGARNAGMAEARGGYVMFVDADDWVEPGYCRVPYELAEGNGADLVIFGFRHEGFPTAQPQAGAATPGTGSLTNDQAMRLLFDVNTVAVWNKLYRRDLVEGMSFPEGRVYEDSAFTPYAVRGAKRIWYCDEELYVYRRRGGSITTLRTHVSESDRFEAMSSLAWDLRAWGFPEEAIEWNGAPVGVT